MVLQGVGCSLLAVMLKEIKGKKLDSGICPSSLQGSKDWLQTICLQIREPTTVGFHLRAKERDLLEMVGKDRV